VIEPLRTVTATRYVEALREGGSLPGLVEADDDGMYVTKFRGAGQGEKALVAEVVAGELGRALGLPVPELVVVDVDERLGSRALSAAGEAISRVPAQWLGVNPRAAAPTSQVHAGLTDDPRATLDRLFEALVTPVTR